jgi:hypothetical protein
MFIFACKAVVVYIESSFGSVINHRSLKEEVSSEVLSNKLQTQGKSIQTMTRYTQPLPYKQK